jgi:histidinol-phosphate aminotransferase
MITHGTLDYAEIAELGFTPEDLIVFSSNINPYGPPPAVIRTVQEAATGANIARYPDRLSLDLRRALAEHHGVAPESILVGNGSADIMWLLALLFMQQKRTAILLPTFGEYENIADLVDGQVIPVCLPGWESPAAGRYAPGETSVEETCAALQAARADVVFLCNPNNPTGQLFTPEEVSTLRAAAPGALWVVDEAYAAFTETPWSASRWIDRGGWLILRSMTKDFSLGGLRLGYAIGAPDTIGQMQAAQPPWNVNVLAQIAGEAALHSVAWRDQSLAQLRQDTAELRAALRRGGFSPLPTTTNYFLTQVGDATAVRQALLREALMVRDCTSFGLPDYIRIATQLPAQNEKLAAALLAHDPTDESTAR